MRNLQEVAEEKELVDVADRCVVEVFSRVTGFYTPRQRWNPGKLKEGSERKTYEIDRHKETLKQAPIHTLARPTE